MNRRLSRYGLVAVVLLAVVGVGLAAGAGSTAGLADAPTTGHANDAATSSGANDTADDSDADDATNDSDADDATLRSDTTDGQAVPTDDGASAAADAPSTAAEGGAGQGQSDPVAATRGTGQEGPPGDSQEDDEFVRGSPDVNGYLAQPTVQPGTESRIQLDLLNTGEVTVGPRNDARVTTARGTTVSADAEDTPLNVTTRETAVGDLPTGAVRSVPLQVRVPDDVEPGEYDVEVRVRYRYTSSVGSETRNERTRTERFEVTVEVDDGARFTIVDADTDAQVGGTGDVTLTMQNVGNETAVQSRVTATTPSSAVTIGEGADEAFVGTWAPGENRTITFGSQVAERFAGGSYVLETTVAYRDRDGIEHQATPSRTGVVPIEQSAFEIDDLEGTLEVGYAGSIEGTLTNEGPIAVDDAVLRIEPRSDRISVGERQYALPELAVGESTEFQFDADVSGRADPGPRQVRFVVEYSSNDGTVGVESTERIEVQPRQPEFDVAVENATVPAGEERQLRVTVTNNRPETLSSINVGLYADSPLTAVDDEAFVDELGPGESTEVLVSVAADQGATRKTYPVEFDFRYDDERGNDRISDVLQAPVEVTEPTESEDSLLPWLLLGSVVLAAAGGVAVWYRRE